MSPLLEFAIHTAVMGGKSTLQFFRNAEIQLKADQSPVTIADLQAEALIRDEIRKWYPEHGIYGEEEGASGDRSQQWLIDPIDGTKSYMSGVPLFSTLLSFEQDGDPVVGVAYFPASDELLYAERGEGAYYQHRPAQVMQEIDPQRCMLCCGAPTRLRDQGKLDPLLDLADTYQGLRTWSDAYGHAMVASGRAPLMVDPLVQPYDISAMRLIVAEAGGMCTNYAGGRAGPEAISFAPGLADWVERTFR